jgi:SHS2 domain-containing protein
MGTPYRYVMLEHTTDAFWEAYGRDLPELFASCALALMDTVVDVGRVEGVDMDEVRVSGHDLESLLYNWLDALIAAMSIKRRVYSRFETRVTEERDGFTLEARMWGETIDFEKHHYKTEVKGVTYHLMAVERTEDGYRARFILDL